MMLLVVVAIVVAAAVDNVFAFVVAVVLTLNAVGLADSVDDVVLVVLNAVAAVGHDVPVSVIRRQMFIYV